MSVLETLEICFTANLSGVTAQLDGLGAQLKGLNACALSEADAFEGAGAELAKNLAEGFGAGLPAVRQRGAEAVSGLLAALSAGKSGASGEGAAAAAGFSDAAAQGVPGVKSAGVRLSEGLAAGIRSGRSAVTAAVDRVVNAALSRMRSQLKIHSPSKVTRGFGAYFGEGFADGILSSASLAQSAAKSLGGGALNALGAMDAADGLTVRLQSAVDAAVQSALGGVQLTIPLNVDGMKLGEASIRGINAVTKSAGRVLLNI